jgi:hypothetical protein
MKMLVYYKAIWSILWLFGIVCGLSVYFMCDYLVYFSRFGMLYQKNLATLNSWQSQT